MFIKKLRKLVLTPNIFFYDMFAKRLNKPVFANKPQTNNSKTVKEVENINNTQEIQKVNSKLNLNTKIVSALIRSALYSQNEWFDQTPWDIISDESTKTLRYGKHLRSYQCFLRNLKFINSSTENNLRDSIKESKLHIVHGQNLHALNAYDISEFLAIQTPVCFGEDGFLHSIGRSVDFDLDFRFRTGCSLTLDFHSAHFDCRHRSWLERFLNSDYVFSSDEILRAKKCIDFIRKNYISKYNNQPIYTPNYCKTHREKVLVIDQAVNDFSIQLGGCNEDTFIQMLRDAVKENPEAEILVKVHPDMIHNPNRGGSGQKKLGHFSGIDFQEISENITVIADYLNPLALLEAVDKVYVATSQMGFEALLCGKEVYIYGCPYYAGWGFGHCRGDNTVLQRRTQKRNIYEVFNAAYIKYTRYINPDLGRQCEIEECLQFLKSARDEYFLENNIRHDLIQIEKPSVSHNEEVAHIAFCFDANYCKQAAVAILSLLDSNKDNNFKYSVYCVIEQDVTEDLQEEMKKILIGKKSLHSLTFIPNEKNESLYETRGISRAAYTRLRLPELLPNLEKVIYSDIDVIFNGSMRDLWEDNLGDYLLGACIDPLMNQKARWNARANKYNYWKKLLFNAQDNYFSSGILSMNLKLLREEGFSSVLDTYKNEKFEYQDMDIINIAINDRIKPISNKYCVLTGLIMEGYDLAANLGVIPKKYVQDIRNSPIIFHFAGKKPWDDDKVIRGNIWWSFLEEYPTLFKFFKNRLLTNLNT